MRRSLRVRRTEWWQRFEAELRPRPRQPWRACRGRGAQTRTERERDGRRAAAARPTVAIAELVSSGAGVLAVCADASRRAALANGATGLARFNGGAA